MYVYVIHVLGEYASRDWEGRQECVEGGIPDMGRDRDVSWYQLLHVSQSLREL